MSRTKVAIIGSGNIGSDLMMKVIRLSETLAMGAMVGTDPASDGLARAECLGIPTTAEGVDGLIGLPNFDEIDVVFDATSARARRQRREARAARQDSHRPHARGHRPVRRPGGQPRRPHRGAQRQVDIALDLAATKK
jgi:acetaldehyde dehydrogenase (acetylating)